jgi:ribonucleoside-diphosphate reductase alpha chain
MSAERRRLPNRRHSEFIDFKSMDMKFIASISRFNDGRIGELFVDNHKAGSAIGTLVRDSAIILSFALQHGADIEAIRRALCRDSQGRALGPIGAALDLLAADEGDTP